MAMAHSGKRVDEPHLSTRVFACPRAMMGKPHAIMSLGKFISQHDSSWGA